MMTSGATSSVLLDRLRTAIEHLAWPAERQRRYLVQIGVAPMIDELALEFDDAFRPIEPLLDVVPSLAGAREQLISINQLLNRMSAARSSNVWGWEALDELPAWADLRGLAERALSELIGGHRAT